VEVLAYSIEISTKSMKVGQPIPFCLAEGESSE
jgi:hypothetical protein